MKRGGSIAARTGRLHFSVFFASVGIAYVYLIPAYAEQLGAGYLDLGLIGTVRSLPYTFLPVIAGYLGDRFGRRRLYLLSIFAIGSATLLLAATGTIEGILAVQVVLGIRTLIVLANIRGVGLRIAGPDFALLVLAVVAFSAIPVVAFSGRDTATRGSIAKIVACPIGRFVHFPFIVVWSPICFDTNGGE